jgi:IS30 family transposase
MKKHLSQAEQERIRLNWPRVGVPELAQLMGRNPYTLYRWIRANLDRKPVRNLETVGRINRMVQLARVAA